MHRPSAKDSKVVKLLYVNWMVRCRFIEFLGCRRALFGKLIRVPSADDDDPGSRRGVASRGANSVQRLLQCRNPGPIGSDSERAAVADGMKMRVDKARYDR